MESMKDISTDWTGMMPLVGVLILGIEFDRVWCASEVGKDKREEIYK